MKKIFLFVLSIAIYGCAHASIVYKDDDGDLLILGKPYDDILKKGYSRSVNLIKFNDQPALELTNVNGVNAIFTFSERQIDKINCIYNNSRNPMNGILNRNAVCGLSIDIVDALDNYSNVINKVSNKENSFIFSEDKLSFFDNGTGLEIEKYKLNDYYANIIYYSLDDFINSRPVVDFYIKGHRGKYKNYYFVYDVNYKLDHILYLAKSWNKISIN
ncbi:hypothetical protein [Vibrio diabolicus]|uniref:hypothetical protein n=1 Tax=Vibrio diabolicus TaxID=50719 RepID=UPI00215F1EC9|nr:hypothetical protein [Vibrio diabolicus]MCS0377026.1 hypothetical protein [Vibrio diabolicus]MCS0420899.1 hypothetical protein [Vibrio diabolicus]